MPRACTRKCKRKRGAEQSASFPVWSVTLPSQAANWPYFIVKLSRALAPGTRPPSCRMRHTANGSHARQSYGYLEAVQPPVVATADGIIPSYSLKICQTCRACCSDEAVRASAVCSGASSYRLGPIPSLSAECRGLQAGRHGSDGQEPCDRQPDRHDHVHRLRNAEIPSRSMTITISCAMARFAYETWSRVESGQPLRPLPRRSLHTMCA